MLKVKKEESIKKQLWKNFKNYIHPKQQASQNFNPDKHIVEISWKVLQTTIANLTGSR